MDNYKKLKKNTLMVFLGNFGSKAIVFLMLPFYTRFLTPEDYGKLDIISTIISLLTPLITLAIVEAIFRLPKNKPKEVQDEYFSTGIILSFVGILSFGIIYALFFKYNINNYSEYSLIIYIIIILAFISSYFQQFSRSIDRMDVYVSCGVIYTIIFTILNIILVKKFAILGYLNSMIISNIVLIIYLFFKVKLYNYFYFNKVSIKKIKEILNYTIPLIPTAIVWWIMNLSDRLILDYYHGGVAVGYYAIANKFPLLISTIFSIFFVSWQISAVDEYKKKDFSIFYNNLFEVLSITLILFNIALMILIYPLMKILVTEKYLIAWKFIPILSLATLYSNFASFIGVNYITFKNTKGAFITAGIGAIVNIILNFILIPKYSVLGASIATLIAYIVLFIFRKYQVNKMVKLNVKNIKLLGELIINLLIYWAILLEKKIIYKIIVIAILLLIFFILNKKYFKKMLAFFRKKLNII